MKDGDGRLFLGVDAGGTKTDVVLATAALGVVARASAPGANPSTSGMDAACRVLAGAAIRAMRGAPAPAGAFFGVAGTGVSDNAARLAEAKRAARTMAGKVFDARRIYDGYAKAVLEAAEKNGRRK